MKINKRIIFTLFIFLIIKNNLFCQSEAEKQLCLRYDKPANSLITDEANGWENDVEWIKALPVSNEFLGAMVFGDVNQERIQLNEKSLWSGNPVNYLFIGF